MQIKAVLFDMFDTLMMIEKEHAFYSPALRRMHAFLVEKGIAVAFPTFRDAYIKARDALYEKADARMEEPHFNLRISNALKSLGYDLDPDSEAVTGATDVFCSEFMNFVRIDDAAAEVLRRLHGKYRLGVVSNFAIPECVLRLLEQHGLNQFLDVVVVSAAVNKRKPSPEIFQKALERLRVDAADAVFVGDTVDADIKGAKDAGMRAVYIERRPQKPIENACPDQTIRRLSELPAALEKC
jgi:putative hydrolase of the HAD superfamily